jgi:hypothetical protein
MGEADRRQHKGADFAGANNGKEKKEKEASGPTTGLDPNKGWGDTSHAGDAYHALF